MKNYVEIANQYIDDVLKGRILACEFVKQACRRQADDLRREDFQYEFSAKAASKACLFVEYLRHVKGPLGGQRIKLEPWQCFVLTTIFGWVDKTTKYRRFKRAYIEVPRGNAKSTLCAAIGLYMLSLDNEPGAGCYSFATTREQAREVFDVAAMMIQRCPDVKKALGLTVQRHAIVQAASGSNFMPKSAQGSTLDGLNTHCAIVDELHAHKTREVFDVVETSLGKRMQPLMVAITTAGFNLSGICFEVRSFVQKVLSGAVEDDAQFGIIYTIDNDDDWTTDDALIKANPNWGVSVQPDVIRGLQAKAMAMASAANNFMTKHLNVWVNADTAWLDMRALARCVDVSLNEDDFTGDSCFIGIDLASKKDIAAVMRLYSRRCSDGLVHYYAFGDYFLPRDAVDNGTNSQYSGWERAGWLTVTEGAVTDYDVIENRLRQLCSTRTVDEIPYDPFQATQLAGHLSEEGLPMLEFGQTVKNMSEPMKNLEAMVLSGRFHYNGDPVLTWMFSNVVCHVDVKENIYPRKERMEQKIDGVVALIMALARAAAQEPGGTDLNAFLDL